MSATVIDTLRFADHLKEAGFERPHAEGLARALGDELAERMLTRQDLHEALRPVHARLDAMDARFDAMDSNIASVHRELSGKFNVLLGVMALGFTLLAGLGGYNAIAPRFGQTVMGAPETLQEATILPLAASSELPVPSEVPQV